MMTTEAEAISADDVIEMLRFECFKARGQRAVALKAGVSVAFLSAVITGKKRPSKPVLDLLGLEKVVTYVRKP
jgi:hypothetical protein